MSAHIEKIIELTKELLFPGLKILRSRLREIEETVNFGMVQAYINLMNFRIGPMAGREGKPPPAAPFQELIRKNCIKLLHYNFKFLISILKVTIMKMKIELLHPTKKLYIFIFTVEVRFLPDDAVFINYYYYWL